MTVRVPSLTAATAGGLALLRSMLGTTGAYLGLGAGYLADIGDLTLVLAGNEGVF